jgi:hypothetical protein
MATINWGMNVVVTDGPSMAADDHFEAEAYDMNTITVPPKVLTEKGTAIVDVQPGDPGDLLAIMITSDKYEGITYKVDLGATPIVLDGPLTLVGQGAISLLGATQNVFTFENDNLLIPAHIRILAIRNAVDVGN